MANARARARTASSRAGRASSANPVSPSTRAIFSLRAARAGSAVAADCSPSDHAHHGQGAEQFFLLRLREWSALGDGGEAGDDALEAVVVFLLGRSQRNEEVSVGAFGQFGFDVTLAAAEKIRADPVLELLEVAIALGPSAACRRSPSASNHSCSPLRRRVPAPGCRRSVLAAASTATSRRGEPELAATLKWRLNRAARWPRSASTCWHVPRPLMRKSMH